MLRVAFFGNSESSYSSRYLQAFRDAECGTLTRRAQPREGASYYSSVEEEDFRLDWSWPAERLQRMVAVSPGRCFTDVAGRRVSILNGKVVPNEDVVPAGTLLRLDRTGGLVECGEKALRVRNAAVDGLDAITLPELCRHLGIQPGDLL